MGHLEEEMSSCKQYLSLCKGKGDWGEGGNLSNPQETTGTI